MTKPRSKEAKSERSKTNKPDWEMVFHFRRKDDLKYTALLLNRATNRFYLVETRGRRSVKVEGKMVPLQKLDPACLKQATVEMACIWHALRQMSVS
jgi:hypothetical protein